MKAKFLVRLTATALSFSFISCATTGSEKPAQSDANTERDGLIPAKVVEEWRDHLVVSMEAADPDLDDPTYLKEYDILRKFRKIRYGPPIGEAEKSE